MESLRILLVSQKGGVGKSTIAANLAAWYGSIPKRKTVLLDFDPHASASEWLNNLKPENVSVYCHTFKDFVAQRWFISARMEVRKRAAINQILIADLTWTKPMNKDFITEFDIIIVPCGVSQVEVEATKNFISNNLIGANRSEISPKLLLCPSRLTERELKTNPFYSEKFSFPLLLLPPLPADSEVKNMFKKNFVFDSNAVHAGYYDRCFKAIFKVGEDFLKSKQKVEYGNKKSVISSLTHKENSAVKKKMGPSQYLTNAEKLISDKKVNKKSDKKESYDVSREKRTWLQRLLW